MNYFLILMVKERDMGNTKKQSEQNIYSPTLRESQISFEWVQITTNKVVVATAERGWLYCPKSKEERFSQPMTGAGKIATTRKLLDTAIAAAKSTAKSYTEPPKLTLIRWLWRLAGMYHLCHPIPNLVKQAEKKFIAQERWRLANWAKQNVQEEAGHDELALKDIQSLGYDSELVVKALVPSAAKVLIDYLTRSVQDSDPIDSVGYAYAMERLALGIDELYIKQVETLLPKNSQATRCLRVHSGMGADVEHVEETVAMVAQLSATERSRIVIACYETALLCFTPPKDGQISDREIQQRLEASQIFSCKQFSN